MADREKVLKGLECHAEVNCVECPYRDGWRTCPFGETLLADAIALLKEQDEQNRKWLQTIADTQLANAPTDTMDATQHTYYDGVWHGLQMAWDIITGEKEHGKTD